MKIKSTILFSSLSLLFCFNISLIHAEVVSVSKDWKPLSARPEIRPNFSTEKDASGQPLLIISQNETKGLDGYWEKELSVEENQHYHFRAEYRTENVKVPRRSALVRIVWGDKNWNLVPDTRDDLIRSYKSSWGPRTRPEHPTQTRELNEEWVEVSGVYQVPPGISKAKIELHLQWAPNGKIAWRNIRFEKTEAPPKRPVRIATIHLQPRGGNSSADKCKMFAPLIEQAAQKKADLVVLPETLTYYNSGKKPHEVAESMPGPSTEYFGTLAKKHNLYLVAGLYEKADHLVYNVAILIGPNGKIIGKYRKVTLPRDEVANGVAPGTEYPVFQTRFGKVGMMICYDGFFPEVARRLSNNGAEIIAFPVWGCNPKLAAARAIENHVYVISSTYTQSGIDWMVSAIFDHQGNPIAEAKDWGSIAIAEVDLNKVTRWQSLGDFKSHMIRHRPISIDEKQ